MAILKPGLDAGVGSGGKTNAYTLAGGITAAQDAEIKRKAQAGIALVNPSAEKTALYNQYKPQQATPSAPVQQASTPFDQNTFVKQMMDQQKSYLDNMYNQQKESQLAAFRAQRDKAVGNINYQKQQVAPQYQNMRNQTDVVNMQNAQKLREIMAANGLNATGENVSANVAMNNERVNSLNKLNLQEQQTMNDFDRQITDLMNPADENSLVAALEAQRSQAMYDAFNRSQDLGYSRYRDSIGDARYADELAYGRGRDTIADQRYDKEWNYNVGRDKVADQRYTNEWNYNVGRDKVADQRYTNEWNYSVGRDKIADQRYTDETQYNRGQDQKQWDYQIGRDKVSDNQWDKTFNRNILESDRNYSRGVYESDRSYAASQKKKAEEAAKPEKPKSQTNSYNDGITYWSNIKDDVKQHGAYRIEKQILSNPEAIKEIRDQGYDINSYIDSLYYVATDGKFKTKKDYEDYVKSITEDW